MSATVINEKLLRNLAYSLKVRHLDDIEKFRSTYNLEIWDKFAGMCPIVKAFLEALNFTEDDLVKGN